MSKVTNIVWALIAAAFMFSCNDGKSSPNHTASPPSRPPESPNNPPNSVVNDDNNNHNNKPVSTPPKPRQQRSLDCIPNPNGDSLGTTLAPQETDNWCGAACAQMVLQSFGINQGQCNIADCMFGRTDCCGPHLPPECDKGRWPHIGFGCYRLHATIVDSAISWDEVKNQISCRKIAFCFSWRDVDSSGQEKGSGHIMVACGYKTEGGEHQVKMLDPYPPHVGHERWISYEYYKSEHGDHVHWKDIYNVRRINQ